MPMCEKVCVLLFMAILQNPKDSRKVKAMLID